MSFDLPFDVVIIGAGASGTLVTAQFQRQSSQSRIALVGVGPRPARGVAYETPYWTNLLNVPAWNMSGFPDDCDHFVRWLTTHMPNSHAGTFAPRTVYGDYLADILEEALKSPNVFSTSRQAVDLTHNGFIWTVHLDNGTTLDTFQVVLALGNLPPNDPLKLDADAFPAYFRNPWTADVATGLASDAPVFLIGMGLTMVDVALALRERGHRGPLMAVSRHGWLSQVHAPYTPRPLAELPQAFRTPYTGLRWIRDEIRAGGEWRAVIDSLRPFTADIWRGWSPAQHASFMRHARYLWDLHRHRMAPEIAVQLNELLQSETLTLHHGRPLALNASEHGLMITWWDTEHGATRQTEVARVVNCTGPNRDYRAVASPLIANLRNHGWLTPDPLHLGWETDLDGRLIAHDGLPVPGLFTLGPSRIPALWESIAIPEIRVQAAKLVQTMLPDFVKHDLVPAR
ncbi:MAG TPA: FAD/NAD(P)-binding protein [Anaerolineales bacterium]|nr:FAD/NAD(P)-binding protein [Anaerolineales bacterium]